MKKLAFIITLALIIVVGGREFSGDHASAITQATGNNKTDAALRSAFANQQSDVQIQGSGEVIKVLPDDNKGNRHQRFILRTTSGQTLLIAHNIDLASRIDGLKAGDHVEFNGEYEWNAKGGVIHWTHHDPQGRHASGWLRHAGRMYQ